MIKQQTVARFMAFSAVFPVIFFTVLIATALYFINQQLIEQKITNYSWQFDEINNGSLLLNHIDFTYNNQLDIRLEKIRFSSIDPSVKKTTFPFFSASLIEIDRIKVKILPKIQTQELPKNTLKETMSRLQSQINSLQSQPEWLAFLPQKIDLTSILIQAPCAIDTCSITGAGSLQLLSSHPKIQLKAQLKLYDQQITSPYIDNKLMVSFANPTKSEVKPVQSELLTYHFNSQIKTTASAISLIELSQTGQLSDTQTASIHSDFSGFLPAKNRSISPEWHNLQTLFQNWSGHSLDLNRLTPYLPVTPQENDTNREDKNSNKTDFSVLINTTFPLDSIAKADSSPHLLQQLSKMAITSEIQAEFNAPFPIPNIGSIQGSAKAKLALKDGAIQHYDLDAKGFFHRTQPITLLDQQENPVFKKLAFTVSSSQIDPTTLNELSALPFKLSVNAISLVPLQQLNSKNSLFAEGTLQLNAEPTITITKGQFSFVQDAFRLNNQQTLKNLSAKGHFTAELNSSLIKLETPQFQAGGDYYDKQLNLHLKQLQINSDTLSVQSQNPAQFLQHLQASAKNINITGDLLLSPQQGQTVSVKNIDLLLSKTELKPTPQSQNKSNPSLNNKTLKTQYRINIARLEQQNLQPLSWTLRGKATSELSKTFDSLHQNHIQGSISNQAGLVVFHNAFYKPNHLYADWELPNIYFLAGNPMQKTFKDWPKQLTLGSGQFKAKGNSQLYLSSLTAHNNLLNTLHTTAQIDMQAISGIYNETTLNQVSSQLNLSLKQGALQAEIEQLKALQINHGIILGPIDFVGHYQTPILSPLQGKLNLSKLSAQLFNGQAWLDKQTFDLSQTIHSQLHLSQIDIKALLEQYPSAEIQGSGRLHGDLPFTVNLQKQPFFTLNKGVIKAAAPGGKIQYQANQGIKQTHQSMQLVFNVLEDFHYSLLESNVSYGADKTLLLKLHLQGKNPAVENGRQVNFNIQLEEDLPALITTMQLSNQVSETIKKRIQEKLAN